VVNFYFSDVEPPSHKVVLVVTDGFWYKRDVLLNMHQDFLTMFLSQEYLGEHFPNAYDIQSYFVRKI
jgi:hypothetical protein